MFVTYDPQFLPLTDVSGAVIFTVFPAIVATLLYSLQTSEVPRPEAGERANGEGGAMLSD